MRIPVLEASGGRTNDTEQTEEISDTDDARFGRLLTVASDDPEHIGWVDVDNPDIQFKDIGVGAMISWQCEIFIPDFVRKLRGFAQAVEKVEKIRPIAQELEFDMGGLPDAADLSTILSAVQALEMPLIAVGGSQ